MLKGADKGKVIKKFKKHDTDTGSPDVQIAILTEEITQLTGHLKKHGKDFSSRRGLLRKIGQRRRLMRYLSKDDPASYEKIVKKLKLKPIAEMKTEEDDAEAVAAAEAEQEKEEKEAADETAE